MFHSDVKFYPFRAFRKKMLEIRSRKIEYTPEVLLSKSLVGMVDKCNCNQLILIRCIVRSQCKNLKLQHQNYMVSTMFSTEMASV